MANLLDSVLRLNKNTILHIQILSPRRFPKSTKYVEQILVNCHVHHYCFKLMPKEILRYIFLQNVALAIVKYLIQQAKSQLQVDLQSGEGAARPGQMLRLTNNKISRSSQDLWHHIRIMLPCERYIIKMASDSNGDCLQIAITEDPVYMNPEMYKAAAEGTIDVFKGIALDNIVTPYENTILHIHLKYTKLAGSNGLSGSFVKLVLDLCPSLLLRVNAKGDTPLHVAARHGHDDAVKVLIECARALPDRDIENGSGAATQNMLRMTNKDGKTALHEAAKHPYWKDVVRILTIEDPYILYSPNSFGQTPLYIAAENECSHSVFEILRNCKLPSYEGPNGKTALHGAVSPGSLQSPNLIKEILGTNRSLTQVTDQYGWNALHYAAYYGEIECLRLLLQYDKSAAFVADRDRNMTALHLAASQGKVEIMEEIINNCPDCCDLVDGRGWNALHFAMLSLNVEELKVLLKHAFIINLINEKDVNGNTPFHVVAVASNEDSYCDIVRELMKLDEKVRLGVNFFPVNYQNVNASETFLYGHPELKQEILELSKVVRLPYNRGVIRLQGKLKDEILTKPSK